MTSNSPSSSICSSPPPPAPLAVFPSHPNCSACPLHSHARSPGIATIHLPESRPPSPTTPAIIYLGQNPGYDEDLFNTPFIGHSGRLLRSIYIRGIDAQHHASIYLTNAARCHTPDNAKPKRGNVKTCFSTHTLPDIISICKTHSPSEVIIVCLGIVASNALHRHLTNTREDLKSKEAFALSGTSYPIHPPKSNIFAKPASPFTITVFHMHHPAYLMRQWSIAQAVHDHNQLILDHLLGISLPPSPPQVVPWRFP